MPMPTTTTHNGQVTIPKRIRDAFGLTPGSAVDFAADKDGNVILRGADKHTCEVSKPVHLDLATSCPVVSATGRRGEDGRSALS